MIKEVFFYTRNNEQSTDKISARSIEVHKSKNGKEKVTRKKTSLCLPVKEGKSDETSMWKFYTGDRSSAVHTTTGDCRCSPYV